VKVLSYLIAFAVVLCLYALGGGFVMMLFVGDLHHWNHSIPTMGFTTSLAPGALLRLLTASYSASDKS